MRKYNCLLLKKTQILPSVDQVRSQEFVMGGEAWSPQRSAIFTIFKQNNAFLGLNFRFKTCSDNS